MKIVMIALEFPPANTTGNYRSAGFARALILQGHQVGVITINENELVEIFGNNLDKTLLNGLEKVNYLRLSLKPNTALQNKRWVASFRIFWSTSDSLYKRLFVKANRLLIDEFIFKNNPDVVFVTLPPFSAAYLAEYISDQYKKPLVVDMRDGWSLWGASPFQTKLHYYKTHRSEARLFKKAKAIIAVTPEFTDALINQHPNLPTTNFHTVMNGYDNISDQPGSSIESNETIKIGYIGQFYYSPENKKSKFLSWFSLKKIRVMLSYYHRPEKWIYRSPFFFLKAMQQLNRENPSISKRLVFELIGNEPVWLKSMISDLGLNEQYICHGFKTKKDVLKILSSWHGVLATSEKVVNGVHFSLPSKIFEVVASQKPILAFVTEGSLANFLKYYPQTIFFNPDDEVSCTNQLRNFCNNPLLENTRPLMEVHSRLEQSKILEKILLNSISKNKL